ncbi:MAG: sugar transporter permease [Candidatus Acidoferrum typicum]|nr:sugar transporter permease [Candidatus Acidoferrum typicum]
MNIELPSKLRPSRLRSNDGAVGALWALLPVGTIALLCFVICAVWTVLISLTDSQLLPHYNFIGLHQYHRLFASGRWWTAIANAGIFGGLLIVTCNLLGYLIASLIDSCGRVGNVAVVVILLPLSVSFVATGLVWRWTVDPELGIQAAAGALGLKNLTFDWIMRTDRAIYVVALAGIWQQIGIPVMLFLAGLRQINGNIWDLALIDGIPRYRVYWRILAPTMFNIFLLNSLMLLAAAAKSFELVVVLTGGGPGFSSDVPAHFIVEHIFERQELALGSAGASVVMLAVFVTILPSLYAIATHRRIS